MACNELALQEAQKVEGVKRASRQRCKKTEFWSNCISAEEPRQTETWQKQTIGPHVQNCVPRGSPPLSGWLLLPMQAAFSHILRKRPQKEGKMRQRVGQLETSTTFSAVFTDPATAEAKEQRKLELYHDMKSLALSQAKITRR